jgi:hypothetical protein
VSTIKVNTIQTAAGTGSLTVPAETGTVVVKDGSNDVTLNDITAGGIYLGGTGTANYLDDYEEGTFTPYITGDSTVGTGTYTNQVGKYTKIGNMVFCQFYVTWSNHTGTGGIQIDGFPFSNSSGSYAAYYLGWVNNLTVPSGHALGGYMPIGPTEIELLSWPSTGGSTSRVSMDTSAGLIGSVFYSV